MLKSRTQATQSPGSSRVLASLNRALSNKSLTKALAMSVEILRENSDHFDWVGIYLVRENDLVWELMQGMKRLSTLGYR
jgi:putative methionine-R-sulfoxide reductase with GAF domain